VAERAANVEVQSDLRSAHIGNCLLVNLLKLIDPLFEYPFHELYRMKHYFLIIHLCELSHHSQLVLNEFYTTNA
jgi:hypothetical protein